MSEMLAMGGNGAYVWTAYGITLVVSVWNVWAARARLKRSLRAAARERDSEAPSRPRVREL